jgi:hypothetical protein
MRSNIEQFGYHVYLVLGRRAPRFAYTIGLTSSWGAELMLAGGAFYSNEDVKQIIDAIALERYSQSDFREEEFVDLLPFGTFQLQKVHASWATVLARGAYDYLQTTDLSAVQIVPSGERWTIDVPDLSRERRLDDEPVWQWLTEPWPFSVSDTSVAVTNLDALRGKRITEAVRWEDAEWELFAGSGPDTAPADVRRVPLATLLAADQTLAPVAELEVGKGLWREASDVVWHEWRT